MNPAQIIAALAAQAAQGVHTNTSMDGYVQVIGRLVQHTGKWSAISASGLKCRIVAVRTDGTHVPCVAPAIGTCIACNAPTCFSHAMISPDTGDLVCYGCVARLTGASPHPRRSDPEPSPQAGTQCTCTDFLHIDKDCPMHGRVSNNDTARRRNLAIFDLDDDADWEDVAFAYKKLVRKHHPDRHPVSRKARQEKRIKKINAAYTWLKKHYEEAA